MLRSVFYASRGRINKCGIRIENWEYPCHQFSTLASSLCPQSKISYTPGSEDLSCNAVSLEPFLLRAHASQRIFSTDTAPHTATLIAKGRQGVLKCSEFDIGLPELYKLHLHDMSNVHRTRRSLMQPVLLSERGIGSSRRKSVRWFSSGGNGERDAASSKSQETSKSHTKEEVENSKETSGSSKEEPKDDKVPEPLDPRAFLLGTRQHLKKATELEVGDMFATYLIFVLLAAIVFSPIVTDYMRHSESTYDEMDTDDQVADLSRIIRRDFLDKISEDAPVGDKGAVDFVLADVLSSKTLQQQAIKFVVSIVQSEEVKKACQALLQGLWDDLVKDPETTAQVIYLLHAAIQNEDIRLATKDLVLEIVEDPEVLEELVRLLQKLGKDKEVLNATQSLLTESAHNTLNDPDILDHSMEFATDVVGDDVVQRTAGEALRNTLSYAVQPGISIVFASIGVVLLFFSIMSLGYAGASEQDAAVLDQAVSGLARSLQPNSKITDRIWTALSPSLDSLLSAMKVIGTMVMWPFHFISHTIVRVGYTSHATGRAIQLAIAWMLDTFQTTFSSVVGNAGEFMSMLSRNGKAVENAFRIAASWISRNVEAVWSLFSRYGGAAWSAIGTVVSFLSNAPGTCSTWIRSVLESLASYLGRLDSTIEWTFRSVTGWVSNLTTARNWQGSPLYQRSFVAVAGAVEVATTILLACQHHMASFALWVTGNHRSDMARR